MGEESETKRGIACGSLLEKIVAETVRPSRPTLRVGNAFPENDPRSAGALGFILASRELMTKARATSSNSQANAEQERLAIHGMIGAAKEAMDEFRVADSLGCFKTIGNIKKALELARHESDATVCGSLYQLAQRVRNQAAYHWDRDWIERALTDLQGDVLALNAGGDDAATPLLGAITSKILEVFGITEPGIYPRLAELAEALGRLGSVLYAHHTQECGSR